jgi:hypothetical protein
MNLDPPGDPRFFRRTGRLALCKLGTRRHSRARDDTGNHSSGLTKPRLGARCGAIRSRPASGERRSCIRNHMEPDELDELITFLKEELEAGRVKVYSAHTLEALARVRRGSDGKIDPISVDGSVRALALDVLGARMHDTLRQTPLRDVQSRYFDILEQNFGQIFSDERDAGLSPQRAARFISADSALVAEFTARVETFATGLEQFWEVHGPIVEAHLGDMSSLKSVFGGDIFPSYTSNIACSVGLYVDTVVLPDPLSRLLTMRSTVAPSELFRLTVKHALNALGYRELALADVNPPIVVIAPDRFGLDISYSAAVRVAGQVDALIHASRMFGRNFESAEELDEFLSRLSDPAKIVSALTDQTLLVLDSDQPDDPLPEQLVRYLKENPTIAKIATSYGEAVHFSIVSRMMMANDTLLRSSMWGGSPLIDAPASWKYLQWKYEYDAMAGRDVAPKPELLISKALGSHLLNGLPPEEIIELRRNGAAVELREMIGKGITELTSSSDADVSVVADAVIANVDAAFVDHDKRLRALTSSKSKFYGLDVGRYVVNGGMALATALTQNPSLAALTAISQLAGTPSPAELMKRYKELRSESNSLRRSPVGAMFRHLKGKFGF